MKSPWEILAIVAAIIGIVAPIAWEKYSKTNSLEVRLVSSISLVDNNAAIDNLSITYNKKPISNITKTDFVIINTGRQPIIDKNIEVFPTICFDYKSEVLQTRILRVQPKNVRCEIAKGRRACETIVKFRLLNPGDYIRMCAYTSGEITQPPYVDARIADIHKVALVDKSKDPPKPTVNISWPVYVVAFVVVLLFPLIRFFGSEYKMHRQVRRQLLRNPSYISELNDLLSFEQFIAKHMSYVTQQEMTQLREIIDDQSIDFADKKRKLVGMTERLIHEPSASSIIYYPIMVVLIWGIGYIGWTIWQVYQPLSFFMR